MQDAMECVRLFLLEEGFDVRKSNVLEHLMILEPFFYLIGCDGTKVHVSSDAGNLSPDDRQLLHESVLCGPTKIAQKDPIQVIHFDLHHPESLQALATYLRTE
jgi:hypothetical protein